MTKDDQKSKANKLPGGPEPERVKLEGDWEQSVKGALAKPRPAGGWPKPDKKKDA